MAYNGPVLRALGTLLRRAGQGIDGLGLSMQGKEGYVERRK